MPNPKDSTAPNARSRFKAQPKQGIQLGERDEALLTTLFLHQAMTRGQLQTLYFSSVPRCNARLRQLFDWQYVTRSFPSAALYGAQGVYGLGKAGIPVAARRLEMEERAVRELCPKQTPQFLEHTLAIADFYLTTLAAVQSASGVALDVWLTELQCRHEYEIRATGKREWRMEVFKPDGFLRLAPLQGEAYASYFVEIDLGHTSANQFLKKLEHHQRYLESGLFRERFGTEDFHTLVVTVNKTRAENLRKLLAETGTNLFWFTTFEALAASGLFAPVWASPQSEQKLKIVQEF
ncbi:MAG: replication-relaxation family protein [Armatimonadetes bacterium]|nr:replication-relaxation family protein [Armatimonadota bacterium]